MNEKIITRVANGRADLVFNNPERRNAVSLEMWELFEAALARFDADDGVRVVVISGAGDKAFVSGADISKFESERAEAEAVRHYNATTARAYDRLYHFPKPVIAMIQGACVGGGLNLAVTCDLRIASDDSRFAMPAAKLGLGYGYVAVKRLAHVVGPANALELGFTARMLSAEEAYAKGLLNKLTTADQLEAAVADFTDRIVANAPLTIATFKAAGIELRRHEAERDTARLQAMVDACFASEDYVEGRRAFLEKRKPAFKGR